MAKLPFLLGFGAGYVLGARAGRERYEQIRGLAQQVKGNPTVQEAAGVLQAQAGELFHTAKNTVSDKVGQTPLGAKMGHRPRNGAMPPATAGDVPGEFHPAL